jgi:uncharacterized membrane protein YwzB
VNTTNSLNGVFVLWFILTGHAGMVLTNYRREICIKLAFILVFIIKLTDLGFVITLVHKIQCTLSVIIIEIYLQSFVYKFILDFLCSSHTLIRVSRFLFYCFNHFTDGRTT